eukprot:s954_g6.t1
MTVESAALVKATKTGPVARPRRRPASVGESPGQLSLPTPPRKRPFPAALRGVELVEVPPSAIQELASQGPDAGADLATPPKRATRVRFPPLQAWRGERVVFERLPGSEAPQMKGARGSRGGFFEGFFQDSVQGSVQLLNKKQDISAGGLERGSTDPPESLQALEELNKILTAPSLMLASLKQQQAGVNAALWELEQSLTRSRAAMTSVARGALEEVYEMQSETEMNSHGLLEKIRKNRRPSIKPLPPMREDILMFIHLACKKLINTYFFECAISLVIVANSALIGVESQLATHGETVEWADLAEIGFMGTYILELMVRAIALRWSALRDGWFLFDFGLVMIAILEQVLSVAVAGSAGQQIMILRLLRLFRLVRTFRMILGRLFSSPIGPFVMPVTAELEFVVWLLSCYWWVILLMRMALLMCAAPLLLLLLLLWVVVVVLLLLLAVVVVVVGGWFGGSLVVVGSGWQLLVVVGSGWIKQIRSIWRLVYGLMNSSETMVAAFALLGLVLYVFGVLALQVISSDPALLGDPETQILIEDRFSSLGMTMMTLTQFVTVDSIASVYLPLIRQNPWLMFYFVPLILVVSISLMNLVTASLEKEEEKKLASVAAKNMLPDIVKLFDQLDSDRSGFLVIQEMKDFETEGLVPPEAWMSQELLDKASVESMSELFQQLDVDESGRVNREEFIEGLLDIFLREVPVYSIQATKMLRLVRESQLKVEADIRSLQDQLGTKTTERSLGFF